MRQPSRSAGHATVRMLSWSLSRLLTDHSLHIGLAVAQLKGFPVGSIFTCCVIVAHASYLLGMKTGVQPSEHLKRENSDKLKTLLRSKLQMKNFLNNPGRLGDNSFAAILKSNFPA